MRRARVLSLASAVAVVLVTSTADASPEDLFGYGTRTSAMGATGVAHAAGWEAAFHNPALASAIRENKLTLGWGGATFALDAVGAGLPGRVSTSPARGFFIGGDLPLPFGGKLRDRVGIALAFYTPSDVIVRGRVLYPEKSQFPLLSDRAQSVTIRAGLGVDVGWDLRVGAGVAALAELVGDVVAATDVTGRVGTRVESQLVATYAPVVGATYELPANLRVGFSLRGALDARFAVVVDGTKLSSLAIPLFNISGLAQYDPAQAAIEIARVEPRARNVLALQVAYKRWSDFSGVLEPTVVCKEGGAGACGIVPPTIPWEDTFAVRLGAEQSFDLSRVLVFRIRAGGFLETSPLPSRVPGSEAFDVPSKSVVEVPTRYFDNTRVALTTGIGVSLADGLPPIDLDALVQYHLLLPREITSTSASGDALMTGESSGSVKVFGMTAGVRF
jgi:long-chain fatty acid transport protein